MTKNNVSLESRFMSHVKKSNNSNGCWEWTGYKLPNGYGRFSMGSNLYLAHRASYVLFVGEIPDNLFVCHICDNPACVNPSHLFLGTHQDNMNDKAKKNRNRQPDGTYLGSKLTKQLVYTIRGLYKQGYKPREISEMLHVGLGNVYAIKDEKSWKWLK